MASKKVAKRIVLTHGAKDVTKKSITATYDSAADTSQNKFRWAYTDSLTANQANSLEVRRKIWERARYCTDNNSYCYGILDSKAQDVIGKGPRLQFTTSDDKHEQFEKDWAAWAKEVKLASTLRAMVFAKDKDGESFLLKVNKPTLKSKVKLYFQMFEPEQISSNFRMKKNPIDGVKLDQYGDVTHFYLLDATPSDSYNGVIKTKGTWISVDQMIQYAHITRAGQIRGISALTPVLELFEMLRSYTVATLAAAETAANHAGLLYTEGGVEAPADEVELEYEVEVGLNTLKALPYGWKMAQLKPEQPTSTYSEFKNEILREIARCIHSPWNVSSGDSSSYNYSSGQLDWIRWDKAINVEQDGLNENVLERIFDDFATEWVAKNAAKGFDLDHVWMYDPRKHADPVKEANAEKLRMENGTSNLEIECARDGRDWKDVTNKAIEIEIYREEQMLAAREKADLPPIKKETDDEPTKDKS